MYFIREKQKFTEENVQSRMASRGRGRGKDLTYVLNSQKPSKGGQTSSNTGAPKIPKNVDSLGTYLFSLNESNFELYGGTFAEMVSGYSSTREKLQEAVDLIYDATVSDRDSAKLGAMVCEKIITSSASSERAQSSFPAEFRKSLLGRFQTDFKQKDQLRSQSVESWLGIFAFLCHFYITIKIGGEPIAVMGKSILSSVDNLLQKPDVVDDEIDCICTHLKLCGAILEVKQPEQFEQVIISLRKILISPQSSCMVRCVILELVEYKHMGWKDPGKVLDKFYVDALADAVAQDELGADS